MKHHWKLIGPEDYCCGRCGLVRKEWPFFGLWRPWPFARCTGYYD